MILTYFSIVFYIILYIILVDEVSVSLEVQLECIYDSLGSFIFDVNHNFDNDSFYWLFLFFHHYAAFTSPVKKLQHCNVLKSKKVVCFCFKFFIRMNQFKILFTIQSSLNVIELMKRYFNFNTQYGFF